MKTPILLIIESNTTKRVQAVLQNQLAKDDLSHLKPSLKLNGNNTLDILFKPLNAFERVLVNGSLTSLINQGSINVITWVS